jgi:hypothetical protein
VAQIVLGLLWLIDGLLQYQPYMFGKTFITGVLPPNASGQPGIIASPITWIANLIEPHVVLFNAFAATLQVLIGAGLLYRRTVKPSLLVSFLWALGIWFTGEGLGMIFTGTANPLTGAPGAALLYILVGLMCWPRGRTVRTPDARRAARLGVIGERGARFAWAGIWLGSAVLWLLPAERRRQCGARRDRVGPVGRRLAYRSAERCGARDGGSRHVDRDRDGGLVRRNRFRGAARLAREALPDPRDRDLFCLLIRRSGLRRCAHG